MVSYLIYRPHQGLLPVILRALVCILYYYVLPSTKIIKYLEILKFKLNYYAKLTITTDGCCFNNGRFLKEITVKNNKEQNHNFCHAQVL